MQKQYDVCNLLVASWLFGYPVTGSLGQQHTMTAPATAPRHDASETATATQEQMQKQTLKNINIVEKLACAVLNTPNTLVRNSSENQRVCRAVALLP